MTRADRIFSEFIFQCRPRVSELAQVSGARVAASQRSPEHSEGQRKVQRTGQGNHEGQDR